MARYGITSSGRVVGVSVGTLRAFAKRIGRNHALAAELWEAGWYESRMLATFVDEPSRVTRSQMNAWAADFDNWAICDTACFHLFDKSPLAWERVRVWSASPREFVKRAGFALIASLALHDKAAADARFRPLLPLIERGAADDRNFVKKGVSWALRGIGRRSPALNRAVVAIARRLARSDEPAPRWVGKDALRELTGRRRVGAR
jgi:3-methyladenine DNA glycosylase AlkD